MAVRESDVRPLRYTGLGYYAFVGVLLALAGWGTYLLVTQQWAYGLGVTGMNTPAYWGLYIINFVFFVGTSAGGIIIAALVYALGLERFRPVARIAEIVAISCLVLAMVFITLDLGRPDRLYHLLLYARPESPLIWDLAIVFVYLAIAMGMGYLGTRADLVRLMAVLPQRRRLYTILVLGYTDISEPALARDKRILKGLALASIPAAVLLHSITAWILGLVKAQAGWHTALLAPVFIASALASGLALVIVAASLTRWLLKVDIRGEVIQDMGRALALLIPLLGYFLFSELLTVVYGRETAPMAVFQQIMFGTYAPFFWFDLVLGLMVPLIILTYPVRRPELALAPRPALVARLRPALGVALAAVLVIMWAFIQRTPVVFVPYLGVAYSPTFLELSLVLGGMLVILGVLVKRADLELSIGLASALVVLGVLAERTNIVLPSLMSRWLPYPPGSYAPTPVELSLVLGTYALGILAFALLAKLFPLVELEERASPR